MKFKLLIVDDDPAIRNLYRRILQNEHILFDEAESGSNALFLLSNNQYSLVLLDITLTGDIDGYHVLQTIRERGDQVPVIIVSGNGEDFNAVYGYDLGADDYIVKPVNPMVLRAKINSMLRRYQQQDHSNEKGELICQGIFQFDPVTFRFYKKGVEIFLTARETKLLRFLMENPNQVFSKEQIYEQVWNEMAIDDNTVMVFISRLRNKIEDNPRDPQYLRTVWGIGYQFIAN